MNRRLIIRFVLGLILLEGGRVSCQTRGEISTKPPLPPGPSVIFPCEPDAKECKDQIMAHEGLWESLFWSGVHFVEIEIQKLKKDGRNSSVPGAVNFYQGEVAFGKKPRFHKIFEKVNWRRFLWEFDLRGFAEMCFVDPYEFNGTNYELNYSGNEISLGRRCWVYRAKSKKHSKGWHFEGTIWVLPDDLTIIQLQGAYLPMRKIPWPFPVEDHRFSFDSSRKEISPGRWVPDFTCTRVNVATSDFTRPPFRGRIYYFNGDGDKPSANSDNACGMEPV